jgi:hypothetical protein
MPGGGPQEQELELAITNFRRYIVTPCTGFEHLKLAVAFAPFFAGGYDTLKFSFVAPESAEDDVRNFSWTARKGQRKLLVANFMEGELVSDRDGNMSSMTKALRGKAANTVSRDIRAGRWLQDSSLLQLLPEWQN